MKLNIGSGGKKLDGYVNVDMQPEEDPDVLLNIGTEWWPFRYNSVDEVVASHILEHLSTHEFFHCMKEMYRVCRDGAQVHVTLPHPRHDIFLGDPTHQRPVMPGTLIMFSKGQMNDMLAKGVQLTPFWKHLGVDFYMNPKIVYEFEPSVDVDAPDLAWQARHLNNIIKEWRTTLTVVKHA